jgi:RimJ/RimL family protein N-acetyltransferase
MKGLIEAITICDYAFEDIPIFVDYWHDTSTTHIRDMGVQQNRLPSRQAMSDALRVGLERRLQTPQAPPSRLVAIRANARTIGFHQITDFDLPQRTAVMHCYITDASWRGRGVGTVSYAKSMKLFFEWFDLRTIIFETPDNNPAALAVKRKLGIRPDGSVVIDRPFLIRPLAATRYRVDKPELARILANMQTACSGTRGG